MHIAHSPEDEIKLRKNLENTDEPFDVYIHGSPEHVSDLVLRTSAALTIRLHPDRSAA